MSDDEFSSIQKKLIGWLLVGLLGGNSVVMLLNKNTSGMRYDPFTGEDAKEMEARIRQYIDFRERKHHLSIPPEPTRERIRKLESWARSQDPAFRSGSNKWYD